MKTQKEMSLLRETELITMPVCVAVYFGYLFVDILFLNPGRNAGQAMLNILPWFIVAITGVVLTFINFLRVILSWANDEPDTRIESYHPGKTVDDLTDADTVLGEEVSEFETEVPDAAEVPGVRLKEDLVSFRGRSWHVAVAKRKQYFALTLLSSISLMVYTLVMASLRESFNYQYAHWQPLITVVFVFLSAIGLYKLGHWKKILNNASKNSGPKSDKSEASRSVKKLEKVSSAVNFRLELAEVARAKASRYNLTALLYWLGLTACCLVLIFSEQLFDSSHRFMGTLPSFIFSFVFLLGGLFCFRKARYWTKISNSSIIGCKSVLAS